ncbi:hypothetical protein ALQ86_200184 [Pseudomonas amygdali pv. eriobotryae]|uniref:Uncharacterized protein n=1 Tax=Pseudomonas amygdali pv. eriobotryae TaxID=129137 RepID=A0A3M3A378_PSEA0|nr:hypothetical protein ALQ86_200184 [Pseudomonas amygdali pv. eriobotryae]
MMFSDGIFGDSGVPPRKAESPNTYVSGLSVNLVKGLPFRTSRAYPAKARRGISASGSPPLVSEVPVCDDTLSISKKMTYVSTQLTKSLAT